MVKALACFRHRKQAGARLGVVKTIGMIGGLGWESSVVYYRVINQEVRKRLGGWSSARLILDSFNFATVATAQSKEDHQSVKSALIESGQRLQTAGADVLIVACNTVHRFADSLQQAISIPLLHIADAAGEALVADGHSRVGLLGTKATMQGRFYARRLRDAGGLDVVTPAQTTQDRIHDLVFRELTTGTPSKAMQGRIDDAVDELGHQGCTAVLLACTELALVYGATDEPVIHGALPLYDTAVLHARKAVDFALGR